MPTHKEEMDSAPQKTIGTLWSYVNLELDKILIAF